MATPRCGYFRGEQQRASGATVGGATILPRDPCGAAWRRVGLQAYAVSKRGAAKILSAIERPGVVDLTQFANPAADHALFAALGAGAWTLRRPLILERPGVSAITGSASPKRASLATKRLDRFLYANDAPAGRRCPAAPVAPTTAGPAAYLLWGDVAVPRGEFGVFAGGFDGPENVCQDCVCLDGMFRTHHLRAQRKRHRRSSWISGKRPRPSRPSRPRWTP